MKKSIFVSFLIIFLLSGCHVARSFIFFRPDHKDYKKFPKRQIQTNTNDVFNWQFAEQQLDATSILINLKDTTTLSLEEFLPNSYTNALLVIKNDKIVFEKYFKKYNATERHTSFSTSKGMIATMVGIAIQEKYIKLTEPVTTYIPELLDNNLKFQNITIQHLFEMTSGIKVRGKNANPFGDLAIAYYGNNLQRFFKHIVIESSPGEIFEYKQTDTALLTLILERATGKTLSAYFEEKVWKEIGTEADAFWNLDRKRNGMEKAFCCFNARVRDFAKFARLYLHNGNWNGKQIVSEEWIKYTTIRDKNDGKKWEFSFHRHWFPSTNGNDYTAQGFLGQLLYINPAEDVLILRFGTKRPEHIVDWEQVMRDITAQI